MSSPARFIAVDLGASSGKMLTGIWDGARFSFEELLRFPNGPVQENGELHWDIAGLWARIQEGLGKAARSFDAPPAGIGVDAWGVDFGLLGADGSLVGNSFHYRDSRTRGIPPLFFETLPEEELYRETGVQTMEINTLYQLYSAMRSRSDLLQRVRTFLMIPDLFHYLLCGVRTAEFTEATTTQIYSLHERDWSQTILEAAGVPQSWMPPIVYPGTQLGSLSEVVCREAGFKFPVPVIATASHDTASAIAAIPDMDDSSAFLSSGTWSLVGVQASSPTVSAAAFRLGFTNEGGADGGWLLLKNITGLWIAQQCQRHWNGAGAQYEWADLIGAASSVDPLCSTFDPDDASLHVHSDMPEAIRAYCRRTGQIVPQSAGEVIRCAFESLCLKCRAALDSLEQLTGRSLSTIRVVGGGSLNAFLMQMTADACERRVVAGPAEASAAGNILLQAVATGHLHDIAAGRSSLADSVTRRTYEPHTSAAWSEAYRRFQQFGNTPSGADALTRAAQ